MKNETNIKEHQSKTDEQLYEILKELLDSEEISESSRRKIEEYLEQLQAQILREHEKHQE